MRSSADSNTIPIKNIYYMLCYAWGHLEEKGLADVTSKDDRDIYNLLTRILIGKLRSLVKRGFYREYKRFEEETSTLRGKLLFKESISSFSFKRGKMNVEYEELSHNILHNQLIKGTLVKLINHDIVDEELKTPLKQLLHYFDGIRGIKPNLKDFEHIKLHRSNQHYQFVLDVCRFLVEALLLHEKGSEAKFTDFEQNPRAMAYLFEEFVRSFYKNELPNYRVYRENIYWNAEGEHLAYLPTMQTDISLENSQEKIIIDTKYYQNTLSSYRGSEKIISGNLYQMYAYLSNHRRTEKRISGVLLYPQVNQTLDLSYVIQGLPMKVCTVDLSREWGVIHDRLMEVVG